MSNAIVPGSLSTLAAQQNTSIAESFLSADVIVLVDVSGSMDTCDSRGSHRRYDVACEELAKLQKTLPGKVAVVAFASETAFVPGGVPPFFSSGTDLAGALRFVEPADGTVRFIVISDGQPNDETGALALARTFTSRIDTVFVGSESDLAAQAFLRQLAAVSGGKSVTASRATELAETVQTLMIGAGI